MQPGLGTFAPRQMQAQDPGLARAVLVSVALLCFRAQHLQRDRVLAQIMRVLPSEMTVQFWIACVRAAGATSLPVNTLQSQGTAHECNGKHTEASTSTQDSNGDTLAGYMHSQNDIERLHQAALDQCRLHEQSE